MRNRGAAPINTGIVPYASLAVLAGSTACLVYDDDPLRRTTPPTQDKVAARNEEWNAHQQPTQPRFGTDSGPPADAAFSGMESAQPLDTKAPAGSGTLPSAEAGVRRADPQLVDRCPSDTTKTSPGLCGCGIDERCAGIMSALIHRYSFEGAGTAIVDTWSAANGQTTSALTSTSALVLTGASASFAALPPGLLSTLRAATIELWVTWQGGYANQTVLSFGTAVPNSPSTECAGSPDFFSGSWYRFCGRGITTWHRARSLCEAAGGHLVAIDSGAEDAYIRAHPNFPEGVWIGANDLQTEGQWYFARQEGLQGAPHFWSGDERGSAVADAYENWRRDQPTPANDDPSLDCGFISKRSGAWTALRCDDDGRFVCEWSGHRGTSLDRGIVFTPFDESGLPSVRVQDGQSVAVVNGRDEFPLGSQTHVALVIDPDGDTLALYVDGTLAGSAAIGGELFNLRDADNWIGRSHVERDPGFSGSIAELRIYNRALLAEELAISHLAGTDPAFLE